MSRLLTLLLLIVFAAPAEAQLAKRENAIAVSLLPAAAVVPRGEAVPLVFVMRPKPGWHGYWKNPGDAGAGARVEWQLPPGVAAGELRYPVPDRLIISGLMNYVFEHGYGLVTELRIPASIPLGTRLPIRAKLDYLACTDEICVPESATVSAEVRVGSAFGGIDNRADVDTFVQKLPRPLGREARFEITGGGQLRVAIPFPADAVVIEPYLYPDTPDTLVHSAVQTFSREGDLLIVEVPVGAAANSLRTFDGLLEYADGEALTFTARPGAVPAAGIPVRETAPGGLGAGTILAALLGAFLGGLLLNIMPCVFPILSLKALSLARAGGEERQARREALAYTAGIVLVCLALGALLLALRAGGETVGWAFQLQDPRVIVLLLLLVTAIALNLAGLFELPALGFGGRLAEGGGTGGAFWTGALAAFVATPCTGPFMGAALGAALILPAAAAMGVYAGLGLGLALPFLLLGFVPALRRRLPKPGPWMARLRRILSVPMFLTAAVLAWILSRQAGADGLLIGLAAALVLALCLWLARRRVRLALIPAAAVALAAILLIPAALDPEPAQASTSLSSEAFSEARLSQLRAGGRPVFVYFTADWCITCKVNERGALASDAVAAHFARNNVAVLVGDWTRGDPDIGRFLERQGRSGVPLYLFYGAGAEAEVLPQILTERRLTSLR